MTWLHQRMIKSWINVEQPDHKRISACSSNSLVYQQGEVSQEKAAEIAGLNRRDFLMALAHREVDVFDVKVDELREEMRRG